MDRGGYGISHGDTFHQGKRNYDSVLPCPNGLGVRDTNPRDHEAWRRRIERARGDIATHQRDTRVQELAADISINDILKDIEEIRAWAQSLSNKVISGNGWTGSTQSDRS
jgi:hypothetical protein